MGEITTKAYVDIPENRARDRYVRSVIPERNTDLTADTCGVMTAIDEQSTDIAMGVDKALEAKENQMTDEQIWMPSVQETRV